MEDDTCFLCLEAEAHDVSQGSVVVAVLALAICYCSDIICACACISWLCNCAIVGELVGAGTAVGFVVVAGVMVIAGVVVVCVVVGVPVTDMDVVSTRRGVGAVAFRGLSVGSYTDRSEPIDWKNS